MKKDKNNKFDFEAIKNSPATQVAEREIIDGFDQMNGTAVDTLGSETPMPPAAPEQPVEKKEPTQDINIPIPMSQHTRLLIAKAKTRQNIKSMVVQAIGLWLDVQDGKITITNTNVKP